MSEKKAAQPEPHTTPDQISALQPDCSEVGSEALLTHSM